MKLIVVELLWLLASRASGDVGGQSPLLISQVQDGCSQSKFSNLSPDVLSTFIYVWIFEIFLQKTEFM